MRIKIHHFLHWLAPAWAVGLTFSRVSGSIPPLESCDGDVRFNRLMIFLDPYGDRFSDH